MQFHEIWNHDEIQQLYGIYHNHNNYDHDNNNNHNHSQDSTTCTADSRIKCCGILHSASDVSTILYSSLLKNSVYSLKDDQQQQKKFRIHLILNNNNSVFGTRIWNLVVLFI